MPSKRLNMISDCEMSPWFDRTYNEKALYGDYAGRLVLLSAGNDQAEEYWELRKSVGLFDVPERPLEISGAGATGFLNRMFTRPVDSLRVGRGRYNLLCHQGGGLVCDGILFRLEADRFWYVHADADVFLWMVAHAHGHAVEIRDPRSWVLQVQGPRSLDVLARACDDGVPQEFRYFDIFQGRMGGQEVLVSRTGWSGELGFEVYNLDPRVDGPALWDHLIAAGAGYGMRGLSQLSMNIRRIEAGILNYPTDMTWDTTPYDLGLGMFVELDERDFIGREALQKAQQEPRFSGFRCGRRALRYGSAVMAAGEPVGRVTAYEISPYLDCGVGFALFDAPASLQGDGYVVVDRGGAECPIELVELPFYDAEKNIPRGLAPLSGGIG